jgi:Glucose / Sorbosone dehydrogenase
LRRIFKVALIVASAATSLSLALAPSTSAATLVPIGSFDRPIFITSDPLDPDRLLVVEREGRVILVDPAGVSLFANLESLVSCCEAERGLLSIAPAADFAGSGRFYAAYTGTAAAGGAEGDIRVDAFRPAPAGGGQLLREPILAIGHPLASHNGGQLQLGPDGFLYLSTGDGGGSGDPFGSGQRLDTLLGKVLRVDPRPGSEPPYEVPPDNPFVGVAGLDEIWSYGLRNPWRVSFDRGSGDMVIADVGQGVREEIDHAPSPAPGSVGGAAANYGWNCREGFIQYAGAPASCAGVTGFTDPVFDYPHTDPGGGLAHGCSITGGYVVRDSSLVDLYGRYLYADFCVGELRSLVLPGSGGGPASGDRSEGLTVPSPVSFGEDSCGRIYVVSNEGTVYRLQGEAPAPCPPSPSPPSPSPPSAPPPPPSAEGGGASSAAAGSQVLPRVRLRARRGKGRAVALIVRVVPCGDNQGAVVQLNRGGRRLRQKRLDARCAARFAVRVFRTSTFRAVLGGQRSQVRTIALAKPRP